MFRSWRLAARGRQGRHQSPSLTTRQREVLNLVGSGNSSKEIAARLAISEATVKVHVSRIMRALDVDNRTEAALMARQFADRHAAETSR